MGPAFLARDNYGLMMMRVIRCAQEKGEAGFSGARITMFVGYCGSLSAFCYNASMLCDTPSVRIINCLCTVGLTVELRGNVRIEWCLTGLFVIG